MKVYIWEFSNYNYVVLYDGKNTYWSDKMIPSGGYTKMRKNICSITESRFVYIGEL